MNRDVAVNTVIEGLKASRWTLDAIPGKTGY